MRDPDRTRMEPDDPFGRPIPSDAVLRAALEAECERLATENDRLAAVLARRAKERADEARARQAEVRELERLRRTLEVERSERAKMRAARGRSLLGRIRRLAGRIRRRARRAVASRAASGPGSGAAERDSRRFERDLLGRPASGVAVGPLVSVIVVATRGDDDGPRLDRLWDALVATTYRPLEIVAAVAPGTELPALPALPLRRVDVENGADSAARRVAVDASAGELVAVLDGGAVPMRPDWLGCLVETLRERAATVVGASVLVREVRPRGNRPRVGSDAAGGTGGTAPESRGLPDATVLLGYDLVPVAGMPRGCPVRGDRTVSSRPRDIAAISGVAVLATRETMRAVGPLAGIAPFDQEDVDFSLRVRAAGGRVIVDPRAVVGHPRPIAVADPGDRRHATHARAKVVDDGAVRLAAAWGPRLYRSVMVDRMAGRRGSAPPGVAVVGPGDGMAALGHQLAALGWAVDIVDPPVGREIAAGVDLVLSLSPSVDLRPRAHAAIHAAWIVDPVPWCDTEWLDEYDILLVANADVAARVAAGSAKLPRVVAAGPDGVPPATAVRDAVLAWIAAPRAAIYAPPPDWGRAHQWGDYPFARDLQRALERRGLATTVYLRDAWSAVARAREDAAIQLIGLGDPRPLSGQLNAAWIISHPERLTDELLAAYSVLFVASDRTAAALAASPDRTVVPLHQATDPQRFRPEPGGPAHDLLYVANCRPTRRKTIANLVPTAHDLGVYGRGWTEDFVDPRYVKAEHVPNRDLHRWYAAAGIVLNDHWDEMAAAGFITNRVYDVLASGGFVLSDEVPGIAEEFDGGVATYASALELRLAIDHYLADPAARKERAARGRAAVLARHTFDDRAATILAELLPRLAARPSWIEPDRPGAEDWDRDR